MAASAGRDGKACDLYRQLLRVVAASSVHGGARCEGSIKASALRTVLLDRVCINRPAVGDECRAISDDVRQGICNREIAFIRQLGRRGHSLKKAAKLNRAERVDANADSPSRSGEPNHGVLCIGGQERWQLGVAGHESVWSKLRTLIVTRHRKAASSRVAGRRLSPPCCHASSTSRV